MFYCISVLTGLEEKFRASVERLLSGENAAFSGTLHLLKKRMRLKSGKEYYEAFFPGYVFLESLESDPAKLAALSKGKGFIRFLPSSRTISPLHGKDLAVLNTILKFGSTVGIVPVTFNNEDRVIITDGPFKDFSGKVVAVNKRNRRINIQIDFMDGVRVVGLSYEVVKKAVQE